MYPGHWNTWGETESVGYEDRTGALGGQISYGAIPASDTSYYIPPACTDMACPAGTTGVNLLVGDCKCTAGYHGIILIASTAPYYTGSCATATTVRPTQPPAAVACPANYATELPFFDIAATGAKLLDSSTPESAELTLPFAFPWYGDSEATITVGVDGLVTFGAAPLPTSGISEPLPCVGACEETDYNDDDETIRGVDGMLAPFWADLDLGESGAVYVQAFADSVVVQWDAVSYQDAATLVILTVLEERLSTHSCNGVYMATKETTSQGSTVYRPRVIGNRLVYWYKPSGGYGRWVCDSDADPRSYFGYLPSHTESSGFGTMQLWLEDEWQAVTARVFLISESHLVRTALPLLTHRYSSTLSLRPC
jgi:hypothetical protein